MYLYTFGELESDLSISFGLVIMGIFKVYVQIYDEYPQKGRKEKEREQKKKRQIPLQFLAVSYLGGLVSGWQNRRKKNAKQTKSQKVVTPWSVSLWSVWP